MRGTGERFSWTLRSRKCAIQPTTLPCALFKAFRVFCVIRVQSFSLTALVPDRNFILPKTPLGKANSGRRPIELQRESRR